MTIMKHIYKTFAASVTFFLIFLTVTAQNFNELYTVISYPVVPAKFCDLHKDVKESSGLIYFKEAIWTMNDSGGLPEIYKIDKTTGEIIQTVNIGNGSNVDWEDITQDENYIYAGDFGNNNGNRKDLKIYKIPKRNISNKKKITITAEIIEFTFHDQQDFTGNSRNHDFDCESVVSAGDSLILFSKNWADNKTRMYRIPKVPGKYEADPEDTFDADGLITGADYLETSKSLILIGYKNHIPFMFLFRDFNGISFGKDEVYRFDFVRMPGAQTEGVAWLNKDTVVFSTEQTKEFTQQAWELNLQTVFDLIKGN